MGTKRNIKICFGVLLVLTSMFLPAASATKYWVVGHEFDNVLVIVDMDDLGGYTIDPLYSNDIGLDVYVNDELKKSGIGYETMEMSDKEIILIYDKSAFEGIELEPGDKVEFTFDFGEEELKDMRVLVSNSKNSEKIKDLRMPRGKLKELD